MTNLELPASLTEPSQEMQGEVRRNFNLGVVNGVLFILAETLMDPTLVLVAFISRLTQSSILLGLVVPLKDSAWALPQLWVSGYLQNQRYKLTFYRRTSGVRMACWALIAVAINFVHDPQYLLPAFFFAFVIGSLASGLSGLPFLEVVGKTVPPARRGEFFAWRFGLGGLLGIGGSALVRWLLDPAGPLPFPQNFGMLSFLYFVIASVSLMLYNNVREPADECVLPRASLLEQIRRGIEVIETNLNYRRFIGMQALLLMAGAATPFFAIYVQQELGGDRSWIGIYLALVISANLVSNLLFGRISRRFGNRKVLELAAMAGMLMSSAVLVLMLLAGPLHISGQTASYLLIPVFLLSGVRATGIGVSGNSLLLDLSPESERSLYVGFTQTLQGIVLLLTSLSGVALLVLGYNGLVGLTVLAHGAALIFSRKISS